MPVDVHHSGPEAHREPTKKSLEDREILGHGCGIYPWISRALRLIRGVGGTRGRLSESDPTWAANGVARHRTRHGSTWVDHVQSEWHMTGTSVTWDFRGGGRTTCRGKSRGDGWNRYSRRPGRGYKAEVQVKDSPGVECWKYPNLDKYVHSWDTSPTRHPPCATYFDPHCNATPRRHCTMDDPRCHRRSWLGTALA